MWKELPFKHDIDCLLRRGRNSIFFFSLLRVAFGMKFHAESIGNTCLKNLKKWSYDVFLIGSRYWNAGNHF